MNLNWLLVLLISLTLTACEQLAILTTPKKQPIYSKSEEAKNAQAYFWQTLHGGHYENISQVDLALTAAYLQNPNDPKIAAHLGFLHIWKITERGREASIPPTIVNEIILSRKYFKDAVTMDPSDARYLGFYGDTQLAEGQIFNDQQLQTRGYFTLKKAIKMWPQFNYFSAGFVMSTLPPTNKYFKEGLEWQWLTLDLCAQQKVNRNNPTFAPYMKLKTQQGPQRACWNSWIAPYNFEGFFLNMGDMLVKAGDWRRAQIIYKNAQLEKNYSQWPYRDLLEKRILNAKENVSHFQKNTVGSPETTLLFNSGYGCVACHQR